MTEFKYCLPQVLACEVDTRKHKKLLDCTECVLDGTDACPRGAGRAVDSEVCEEFLEEDKESE